MPDDERSIRRQSGDSSNGTPYHLVEIYAHNTIHELILKVREQIRLERGKYSLPNSLVDRLEVDCATWVLEKGVPGAELNVRGAIMTFLDERERLRLEEDERKVKARMPRS